MTADDEIRGIIARVAPGDKLELTFKPGFGEEQHLRARGVEAIRYLALRHNSKEFKFSAEDGQRLWAIVHNRAFGAGNSRTFTMIVPQNFELLQFADKVYEELEDVKILPQVQKAEGEPILSYWFRRLFS